MSAAVQVTHHEVRYERNTVTGMWRARCTCGWYLVGTQEDVQKFAAAHDEWVAVEPSAGAVCEGCGKNYADPPSKLCPGCEAYQEHQR